MAHSVDDDLCLSDLVENQIRIWRRRQTANDRIIRANADIWMSQKQPMIACIRA
jgi:hypothetical protein